MSVLDTPTFTILPDHESRRADDSAGRDFFALESRLGPMFDVLRHKDTERPISMAIYGGDGTGKSTALQWLQRHVELWNEVPVSERDGHPAIIPVHLSAKICADPARAGQLVMTELLLQVMAFLDNGSGQQRLERVKRAVDQCGASLGRGFIQGLECLARRWDVMSTLRANSSNLQWDSVGGPCHWGCLDLLKEWLTLYETKSGPVRIAVFIDDMDHVQPDVMIAFFDVINLQLCSPLLEFVVAVDPQITTRLVKQHFTRHDFGEMQVRHYLSKIFQVDCDIEPSQQQVLAFYHAQYDLLDARSNGGLSSYLTPAYRGCMDQAVLHLSAGNPRKIKLLLNSAFMKGFAALRAAEKDGVPEEQRSLSFVQHIQLFFLQRWLSYFSIGGSAIYRDDVLNWFNALSEEARASDSSFDQMEERMALRTDCETPAGLGFHMVHEWIWNLLKIPFSAAVAGEYHDQGITMEEDFIPAAGRSSVGLESVSMAMKDALAAALEKASSELTEEDMGRVVELDLAEHTFAKGDVGFMGCLTGLKRLDLHNSSLDRLEPLESLTHLRSLNLTCTKVQSIEPLRAFAELEMLDLSFSMVEDISPLEAHHKLTTLVLYGAKVRKLDALKGLESLARLNLSCTEVGDEEIEVLKTLPSLNTLFLRQTKVTLGAASKLNKAFDFSLKIER